MLTSTEELKRKEEHVDGESTFIKTSMKREKTTLLLYSSVEVELQDWRRMISDMVKRRAASSK